MKFITFKIDLTETTIQINNGPIYPLNIEFNKNEIIVCQQETNENTLTGFVHDLFTNPTEYKKYQFEYQQNQYEVLAETLLALIIYQFKKNIDKEGIINRIELNINNENEEKKEIIHRIKSSLININIPNEFTPIDNYMIRPREEFYVDEEYIVYEIIQKEEQYQKCIFELNRAKQLIFKTRNAQLKRKKTLTHFNHRLQCILFRRELQTIEIQIHMQRENGIETSSFG